MDRTEGARGRGIMLGKTVAVLALAASCLVTGVPPSLAGGKSNTAATRRRDGMTQTPTPHIAGPTRRKRF